MERTFCWGYYISLLDCDFLIVTCQQKVSSESVLLIDSRLTQVCGYIKNSFSFLFSLFVYAPDSTHRLCRYFCAFYFHAYFQRWRQSRCPQTIPIRNETNKVECINLELQRPHVDHKSIGEPNQQQHSHVINGVCCRGDEQTDEISV